MKRVNVLNLLFHVVIFIVPAHNVPALMISIEACSYPSNEGGFIKFTLLKEFNNVK